MLTDCADGTGRHRGDSGAASLLGVGILVAVLSLAVSIASLSALLVERHRLGAVADAAALAAADSAVGLVGGLPCAQADRLARANDSRLDGCQREGTTVTVRISSDRGVLPIQAVATAGQPEQKRSVHTVGSKK